MLQKIKSISVLVAICAVMALLLAVTNQITAPIIEQNKAAQNSGALQQIIEGGVFEMVDLTGKDIPDGVTEVHKDKNSGGYVVYVTVTGYKPGMTIACGVTADGKVIKAICTVSSETNGAEKTYGDNFAGKDAAGVDATDTVGGSTMTTTAYRGAVKTAVNTVIKLGGGVTDDRTPEEIFNDNLKAALPAADEFVKTAVVDESYNVDFIYAAKNGAGYVYVIGKDTFIGVDAEGNATATGYDAATVEKVKALAALAASQTKVDTTDSGINENITAVQKTADGNYIIEINGLGFGWFGDPGHYMQGREIPIQICAVISPAGKMLKCVTVAHSESQGYGAVCGEESYYNQFTDKTLENYKEVDGISGATITTSGYMKAVERCFKAVEILEGGAE